MMTKTNSSALLVFSIGPVQDFIAAARRTQDLWMGSYILAYLSAAAMRAVVKDPHNPKEILYPVLDEQPLIERLWQNKKPPAEQLALATLPNKFTASVESLDDGKRLAKDAQEAVYTTWREIAAAVAEKFPGSLMEVEQDWKDLWALQTTPERWLEIYWVVYPNDDYSHGEFNRRTERAFEARKGLRDFIPTEEHGEKCTVCGLRAALTNHTGKRRKRLRDEWKNIAQALHDKSEVERHPDYKGLAAALSAEGHERLCAICSMKRFAQRFYFEGTYLNLKGGFPSTSSIASVEFRRNLMKTEIRKDRKAFVDVLQKHHIPQTLSRRAFAKLDKSDPLQKYDGDLFYLETYTQKHLQDDYGVKLKESEVISLQSYVKDLRKKATGRGIDLPPKYYALLLMDGDHMGRRLRDAERLEEHRAISESLRAFSVEHVPRIVAEKYGRVVYAGGDDLMVFLPLKYILDAANEMNQAFHQTTNGFTASAGIVIAHHTAPLDGVLQAARRAEKKAKDVYNRNAVVFSVLKRSGEKLDVGGHWQETETLATILELRDAIRRQKEEDQVGISPKFAFEAEAEALALSKLDKEAHQKALSRLLKRHGADDIGEELPKRLAALGNALGGDLPADTTATLETARWMLLARFLAAANTEED